ncbi:recombinase family protein [Micromonospora sp. NBC_00330]|uniref:recombinase family protein n=1 Tax=Micromonospora sp. NBC_00330 TaxID=2903585 RepID=UPI002E2D0FAD|nr:recombinase family protein [Micromonospora sp. NBC_00330]
MKRAAIYCRISRDKEGRELGVARQRQDCEALAQRLGWDVLEVFVDNDISASTRSTKPRPGFEDMIRRVEAGEFNAILSYSTSRLTRRPMEHERLIPLFKERKIPISTVKAGDIDYTTARGRSRARDDARRDAEEAEEISERVSRAAQQRAENGEWHGGTQPFGFLAIKEVVKGRERVVDLRPHPEHAAWVKDAIDRLLAGESLYGICTDWNRQGRRTGWKQYARTESGGFVRDDRGRRVKADEESAWHPRTLKRVVTSPTIAGYRELDGQLYEATWKAIVDREDWERVCTLLAAPERKLRGFNNGNARKYSLSGLVFCAGVRHDECDHPKEDQADCRDGKPCGRVMVSMTSTRVVRGTRVRRVSFVCNQLATGGCGSMRIEMAHLERYIFEQVFHAADSPELRTAMSAQADDIDEAEQALRKSIGDGERLLERVEDEYDAEEITKIEYRRRRSKIIKQVDADRAALAKTTRARVHTRLPSGTELRKVWNDKDNTWKRTIIGSVIERIDVSRHPAGVATNLTPTRDEDPGAFSQRLDLHRRQVLGQRVDVQWWA